MEQEEGRREQGISKDRLTIDGVEEELLRALRYEAQIERGMTVKKYVLKILRERKIITDKWEKETGAPHLGKNETAKMAKKKREKDIG